MKNEAATNQDTARTPEANGGAGGGSVVSPGGRWILLAGLLLAITGASFAPWVDRPPAVLVLTAPDLAEFVKFLPQVRAGTLSVTRLAFLFPLFVATASLPIVVTSSRLGYSKWVSWPALALVVPMSLTLLPPVWSPGVLIASEFRWQTAACVACLGLVVVSRWLRFLPWFLVVITLVGGWLTAPAAAWLQFWLVRQAVSSVYAGQVLPGWGAWATLIGFGFAILGLLMGTRSIKRAT